MQCSNNLNQVGLAMHNYDSAYKRLPAGQRMMKVGSPLDAVGTAWVGVLPFMENSVVAEKITSDVPAMHLLLEDKDVGDFNSHLKVLPPFRTQKDRKALIKGLKD